VSTTLRARLTKSRQKKTEFSKIFSFFEKESLTGHHIISSWPKKKTGSVAMYKQIDGGV
jgi:hypothetical protein